MIFYNIAIKTEQKKTRPMLFASGSVELLSSEIGALVNLIYYGFLDRDTETGESFRKHISWLISEDNPAVWERQAEQDDFGGILSAVPKPEGGKDDG